MNGNNEGIYPLIKVLILSNLPNNYYQYYLYDDENNKDLNRTVQYNSSNTLHLFSSYNIILPILSRAAALIRILPKMNGGLLSLSNISPS